MGGLRIKKNDEVGIGSTDEEPDGTWSNLEIGTSVVVIEVD
jgi:hypothetical protein